MKRGDIVLIVSVPGSTKPKFNRRQFVNLTAIAIDKSKGRYRGDWIVKLLDKEVYLGVYEKEVKIIYLDIPDIEI